MLRSFKDERCLNHSELGTVPFLLLVLSEFLIHPRAFNIMMVYFHVCYSIKYLGATVKLFAF